MDLSTLYTQYKGIYADYAERYEKRNLFGNRGKLMPEGTFRATVAQLRKSYSRQYDRKGIEYTEDKVDELVLERISRIGTYLASSKQENALWRTAVRLAHDFPDSQLRKMVEEQGIEGFRAHTTDFLTQMHLLVPSDKDYDALVKEYSF